MVIFHDPPSQTLGSPPVAPRIEAPAERELKITRNIINEKVPHTRTIISQFVMETGLMKECSTKIYINKCD